MKNSPGAETDESAHEHEHTGPFGERAEFAFSLVCGLLTGIGWATGKLGVVALHEGSTLLVVVNALRQLAYEYWGPSA